MNPMTYIRTEVFKCGQAEMASLAGVTQATVSRWEAGEFTPNGKVMARIREEAAQRRLKWRDAWFFDPPPAASSETPQAERAA